MSKSPILLMHLVGLTMALGAVLIMDVRLAKLLRGRIIEASDLRLVDDLTPFARLGLVLLWLSGGLFLGHYAVYSPELLGDPKLHAKLFIVVVLTLNGALVEGYALPAIRANRDKALFEGLSRRRTLALVAIAAVSAVSWYAPLVLGAVRELNFLFPAQLYGAAYLFCLGAALAGLLMLKAVLYRPEISPELRSVVPTAQGLSTSTRRGPAVTSDTPAANPAIEPARFSAGPATVAFSRLPLVRRKASSRPSAIAAPASL